MSRAPMTPPGPRRPLGFWGTLRALLAGLDAGTMVRHGHAPPPGHPARRRE